MGHNRLCKLLGIKYPIIQAPMNWVSGADLVAAVSNAGGLGTLGPNAGAENITSDVELTGERMRAQIKKVRRLSQAPFAVNIVVGVGEDMTYSKKIVDVVIEEAVPVAIVSVGRPDIYTDVLKAAGVKVLHAISTARHGQKAERAGVDAVVCEGFEAGGHKGFTELTTLTLTPMVADAVDVPVIAGGGIGDARSVLAIMALGADGIYMGTRFMVTHESESHPRVKAAIVNTRDVCTISVPKDYMLARDLINDFTKQYLGLKKAGASNSELSTFLNDHSQYHSQHLGKADNSEICCGQVAGLINDVKGAGEVVEDVVGGIAKRFEELKARLGCLL
ncbi:NAD(P)H-dependent flavin oxidoreductase [Desulfosarcina sp.]|uniref:NAD(P)H-dependent flavin oxidoreductase n=1 Tax=Desulfosarcina sp. TaxID=2027861 RepID=UPI00356A9F25